MKSDFHTVVMHGALTPQANSNNDRTQGSGLPDAFFRVLHNL